MAYALAALLGYVSGSVLYAVLVCRSRGVSVYSLGSGNPGFTNVLRALGKGPGLLVLLGDMAKGAVPVAICRWPLATALGANGFDLGLVAACAAVLGHTFPLFHRFRGGKAVATAAGGFAVLAPTATGVALLVWLAALLLTRYMSVASIAGAIAFPVYLTFVAELQGTERILILVGWLLGTVIVLRHRGNIARLRRGQENRFSLKKG